MTISKKYEYKNLKNSKTATILNICFFIHSLCIRFVKDYSHISVKVTCQCLRQIFFFHTYSSYLLTHVRASEILISLKEYYVRDFCTVVWIFQSTDICKYDQYYITECIITDIVHILICVDNPVEAFFIIMTCVKPVQHVTFTETTPLFRIIV